MPSKTSSGGSPRRLGLNANNYAVNCPPVTGYDGKLYTARPYGQSKRWRKIETPAKRPTTSVHGKFTKITPSVYTVSGTRKSTSPKRASSPKTSGFFRNLVTLYNKLVNPKILPETLLVTATKFLDTNRPSDAVERECAQHVRLVKQKLVAEVKSINKEVSRSNRMAAVRSLGECLVR